MKLLLNQGLGTKVGQHDLQRNANTMVRKIALPWRTDQDLGWRRIGSRYLLNISNPSVCTRLNNKLLIFYRGKSYFDHFFALFAGVYDCTLLDRKARGIQPLSAASLDEQLEKLEQVRKEPDCGFGSSGTLLKSPEIAAH